MVKAPSGLVIMLQVILVSMLRIVTATPGTTAWPESVTTPVTLARSVWPGSSVRRHRNRKKIQTGRDENNRICPPQSGKILSKRERGSQFGDDTGQSRR